MIALKKILFLSFITAIGLAPLAHSREVTGIAAKVNGKVITKNEVKYHLTPFREQLNAQMPRKTPEYYSLLKKTQNEILDSLIDRELILSAFRVRTNDRRIPSQSIDEEIKRLKHQGSVAGIELIIERTIKR